MKKFKLSWTKHSKKVFKELNAKTQKQINEHLQKLIKWLKDRTIAQNLDLKKLKGKYQDLYRLRVGKYRVILAFRGNEVIVMDIQIRGKAYK